MDYVDDIGIATGNWGCGAFGGDPEVKTIVQWLAASQVVLSLAFVTIMGGDEIFKDLSVFK